MPEGMSTTPGEGPLWTVPHPGRIFFAPIRGTEVRIRSLHSHPRQEGRHGSAKPLCPAKSADHRQPDLESHRCGRGLLPRPKVQLDRPSRGRGGSTMGRSGLSRLRLRDAHPRCGPLREAHPTIPEGHVPRRGDHGGTGRDGAAEGRSTSPFLLISLALGIWVLASIFYTTVFWLCGAPRDLLSYPLTLGLFHRADHHDHRLFRDRARAPAAGWCRPSFPTAGSHEPAVAIRIRIRTRLVALLFAVNFIPFIVIIHTIHDMPPDLHRSPKAPLGHSVRGHCERDPLSLRGHLGHAPGEQQPASAPARDHPRASGGSGGAGSTEASGSPRTTRSVTRAT